MPTTPTTAEIEEYLLSLVAERRMVTIEFLREEGRRCPYDPPWSSEQFVRHQPQIEAHFGIEFDAEKVERVQRSLALISQHIQDLIVQQQSRQA